MTRTDPDVKMLANLVKRLHSRDPDPLRPLIDEYLLKRDASPNRYAGHPISMVPRLRPPGRISPSAVYGCERAAVLRFLGVRGRRRLDPDTELLFEDGNWRHHKWQYMFYDMQEVLGRDRFRVLGIEMGILIPSMYVAGSLDVLIAIRIDGRWVKIVIDIKGINDRGFNWIQSKDEAKIDHLRQLQLYMKAKRVKRGILLYDNKDKQLTRTYAVDFNSEYWGETVEWIKHVIAQLNRKRLPSMHLDCKVGSFMYDHCTFTKLCYSKSMDSSDLQRIAFRNFVDIDDQWLKGLEQAS